MGSKAARVWRRTWIGALMVGVVTALLWSTHATGRAELIVAVTLPLGLAGALELGRMGRLAPLRLAWPAAAAVASLHLLALAAVDAHVEEALWQESFAAPFHARYGTYVEPDFGLELLWAASLVAAVVGLASWGPLRARSVLRALASLAVVGVSAWVLHAYATDATVGGRNPGLRTLPVWSWVVDAGALGLASVVLAAALGRDPRVLGSLAATVGLSLWLACGLAWIVHVWLDWGTGGLVALVVLSKIGDIAGYYVGNAIGRSHPFPSISPGKTTAGCVGSLVAGVAAGAALSAGGVLPPGPWGLASGALAGLVVNLASQAGDLFESWVKRRAEVKDSATYFGPAGGVLDLVDSLLFSVPVAVLAWPLVFSA